VLKTIREIRGSIWVSIHPGDSGNNPEISSIGGQASPFLRKEPGGFYSMAKPNELMNSPLVDFMDSFPDQGLDRLLPPTSLRRSDGAEMVSSQLIQKINGS
jgi:hypothetical protein